jgi:hypothetical protein
MFEYQLNKIGLLMRLFALGDIKLWDRVSFLKFDAILNVCWKPDLVRVKYSVARLYFEFSSFNKIDNN